jgi:hypothetical protein
LVYHDNDVERILDALYSQLVAAHESHQHMVTAAVLEVSGTLLGAVDGELPERLTDDVATAGRLLDETPPSRVLRSARRAFDDAVERPDEVPTGGDGGSGGRAP